MIADTLEKWLNLPSNIRAVTPRPEEPEPEKLTGTRVAAPGMLSMASRLAEREDELQFKARVISTYLIPILKEAYESLGVTSLLKALHWTTILCAFMSGMILSAVLVHLIYAGVI
jgi:hypothetical protein